MKAIKTKGLNRTEKSAKVTYVTERRTLDCYQNIKQEVKNKVHKKVSLDACTIQLLCSVIKCVFIKKKRKNVTGKFINNDEYCYLFNLIFFPIILDMLRIDISYLIVFTYYILSHFYGFIDAICGYIFVYLLGALYSINYFFINLIFLLPYC